MDWVLELRHEWLTPLFLALTFLGDATFFLIFLPLGYWLYRREAFFRLTVLLLFSAFLNSILKGLFQVPRPDVAHLVEAGGWSFPSGHAQTAATLWPWLALELQSSLTGEGARSRRARAWAATALLVAAVAASRVYLGVHYPVDVVAGIAVGLALVALARWWLRRPRAWWAGLAPHWQSLAVAGLAALGYAALPGGLDAAPTAAGGALVGFWVGDVYQRRHFPCAPPERTRHALAVAAVGLAGAFGLRFGLKAAFAALAADPIADIVRYGVVGAWLSYLAPWTFCRLGLTRRREDDRGRDIAS